MKLTSPEAVMFDGPKNPELPASITGGMSVDTEQMLIDMKGADPTIGAVKETEASIDLPESPLSAEELGSSMEDMLSAMSPEARENAESILRDVGSAPVAESVKITLSTEAVAGTDQLEALANDPAEHTNADGTIKTEVSPRMLTSEEVAQINTNLENFSVPQTETDIEPIEEAKSISGRRVLDTKKPQADNPENQEIVDKLTSGKIAELGTKLSGMKDLRAGRKEIISKQREAMEEVVSDARGVVWNARGRRVANWKENNVVKRVGQRSDRRAELRDMAFDAIDNSDASDPRKTLLRLQARRKAWKMARHDVRTRTQESFAAAEKAVDDAKDERDRQKSRAKSVKFSPLRRRSTMGGAGTAGFRETWNDSSSDLRKKEEKRKAEQAKRLAALKARQAKKPVARKAS